MGLEKPYVKRAASAGEVVPIADHNKQGDQLEALTVLANRVWTTGTRPTPSADDLYPRGFNTTLSIHEIWNGVAWVPIAGGVLDWESIGTTRLTGRQNTLTIGDLSCGLVSGGAKYQAIKLWCYFKGGSGQALNPTLELNGDTTGTNYYGATGGNNNIFYGGAIGTTDGVIIEGIMHRGNAMAAGINQYLFGYLAGTDVIAGALFSGGRTTEGFKWLNPDPQDVLTSAVFKAAAGDWEIGSQSRAWGLRPGIS